MSSNKIKDIEPVSFQWVDDSTGPGITAQSINEIVLSDMSMTQSFDDILTDNTITIGTSPGISGTFGAVGSSYTVSNISNISGSPSISFTDPYAEMEERLARLEKIIAEEEEIRKRCEAVNNAYNEYRLLLVLAKRNKGDQLTEE